jgi:outer membrane protein
MKLIPTLAVICLVSTSVYAQANGNWLVRGRVINVAPANDGGKTSIGDKPHAGNDTVPEIDLTYFVTPNFGIEAIAAITEHKMDVRKGTNVNLGKVKLLPPTLTAQYHFNYPRQLGAFKPYVGAGINFTHFYDAEHPGLGSVKYDDTFGTVLQGGVDYKLTDQVYLNADMKKVFLSTDVTVNNTITAKSNLNPTIIGLGLGYRF